MNVADLDRLAESLNTPRLREVLSHPDWPAAYEALQDAQYEQDQGFDDVSPDAQFVHVLSRVTLWVHDGRLWSEDNYMPNGGYAWVDGEWVMGDDLDEEDEV